MRTPRSPLTAAIALSLTLTACGVETEQVAPSASASATPQPSSSGASTSTPTTPLAERVVEVHVPAIATPGLGKEEYPYPWIDDIEDYLAGLDGSGGEEYDSGEELGEEYVFFLSSASESQLIELATRVAKLPGVPAGVYVVVTDSDSDMGKGRRVELKL